MSIRTGRWRRWALEIARRALSLPKHHIKRAKCCSQGKGCLRAIYQALYRVHFPSQALSAVARSCIPSPSSLFPPRVLIHLLANESNLVVHPELPFSSLSPSPSLVATCLPLSVTRCRRETTHYLSLKLKFIQLNMSAVPIETSELKAGHPPAVKVAGMRITQHKNTPHEKPEPKVEGGAKEEEENQEEAPPKVVLSVSGAIARGDQDFPASSVKAFHDKTPKPANEFRPINKNHAIQQPKK